MARRYVTELGGIINVGYIIIYVQNNESNEMKKKQVLLDYAYTKPYKSYFNVQYLCGV